MWTTYLDSTEGMVDCVLINGDIVYQLTYIYSDDQYGFADVWKYVSSESIPPTPILEWIQKYMVGYTGPLNIQYRGHSIIEVSLRFARSGIYLESTNHKPLINAINTMWTTKTWSHREEITIDPYYSFKCWSPIPIVCLLPQHGIDMLITSYHAMPFYEYYFEPTGSHGVVFFQFLHKDFQVGMQLKRCIERSVYSLNVFVYAILILFLIARIVDIPIHTGWILMGLILLSADNSLNIVANQITHQKQIFI